MIQETTQWVINHLVLAVLINTRLSLLLMSMPAIGAGVPKRVRAFLSILMTFLLVPPVARATEISQLPQINNLPDLAIAVAREAFVGLLIGGTIQLIITGFQTGGEVMTGTGGMQLGDTVDPTTQSSMPTPARLVGLLVTAILLVSGGHRLVLRLLMSSFETMPAGEVVFDGSMLEIVVDQLTTALAAGLRIAAPVVCTLLLSNVITGLISRTLPQINVLAIGLSINTLAMLIVFALTIGSAGLIFQEELSSTLAKLGGLF
jgi:flagellar biosynthesis protein FliR